MKLDWEGELNLEEAQAELRRAGKEAHDFKVALDEHAIVAITDPKGRITYVNEKFCEISKYSEEELLGKDHRILNSGHHPKAFIENLWGTIRSGHVWRGEIKNRRKDGSYYWVNTTIVPFLDDDGNPKQYIAIRADITEQKLYEARLQELAGELDRKNQELETVIYAASHDLRSPLVNVQGFSAVIAEQVEELKNMMRRVGERDPPSRAEVDDAGEEIRRSLAFIEAGASKMDALLNGLLVISRVGRVQVTIEDLDVEQLIRQNLAAIHYQLEQAEAEVTVGELLSARADCGLLGQVFANLFGNALKYAAPSRSPSLEISCERQNGKVTYFIKDNGIGIAEAHQERIFDLFHRLDPAETEGHGMGLAIVRRALDRMDGKVTVSSQINKGSAFAITLPAVR